MGWNFQSGMVFHSGPLSGRRKTGPGIEIFNREWMFQTENENFKREWNFRAWGNGFFMRSSENEFFRSLGPLGQVSQGIPQWESNLTASLPWSSIPWCWFSLVFSKQGNSLVFWAFSAVTLCFSRVFTGVERGKKSLVFWVVFLGFYLNTKEWKIRVLQKKKTRLLELQGAY